MQLIDNKEEFKVKIPPIKSQGKKTKLVGWIKDNYDILEKNKDTIYIEPFVGTGVVGFNIAPERAVFSDINPHLINFYNALKDKKINSKMVKEYLRQEGDKLANSPIDKNSYYYEVRERFNKNGDPLDFLFITRACFNGMMRFNKKGGFNVPFCKKQERFSNMLVSKITNQVYWLENKIKNNDWDFVIEDFRKILKDYENNENVISYLDGPYINRSNDYFNGWNEKDEIDLYNSMKNQKGKFILSTWYGNKFRHNEYIEKYWSEFEVITKEHTYQIGAKIENRNEILEALIMKK